MVSTKHLPAGYAVRRATAGDVAHVAPLMRPVDRVELEALEGRPAGEILACAVAGPARVLTIAAEPLLLYGIVACEGLPGHAAPWLATTSTISHDQLVEIMWLSRLQIDVWQRRWPVLQAVCDTRNQFRSDWLQWLGFAHRGHLRAFGAARLPFNLYMRGNDQSVRRHLGGGAALPAANLP